MKIILASHGPLANSILESSKMIYGNTENVVAFTLNPEDSIEKFREKIKSEITNEEVLMFVDIIGGTPFNQCVMLMSEFNNLKIVTGMNLPMFIETLIYRQSLKLDALIEMIIETGKNGIEIFDSNKIKKNKGDSL